MTQTKEFNQIDFDYNSGKIKRKFNQEWATSGFINIDKIPDMVKSLVEQRNSMIKYIEELHDKIDNLIEHNNICDCPSCHTAGCTSDHK